MGHPQPTIYKSKSGKEYQHDAREILAIEEADTACDAIATAATDGCKNINNDLNKVELDGKVLCVADSTLQPALEEVGNYINSIAADGFVATINEMKAEAASVFAGLQQQEDEKAKKECEEEDARYEAELAKKNGS